MKKEIKEKIIEILEEYQPKDPDKYDMNIEGATDQILELFSQIEKKILEKINKLFIKWASEIPYPDPIELKEILLKLLVEEEKE